MILPETHMGDLIEDVLPDLIEVVRAPDHPGAEGLLARARRAIDCSFADDDTWDEVERAWHEGAIDATFTTLLAVAEMTVQARRVGAESLA